eukprot:COSAG02_NODE_41985_length_389_cov_0.541379_1_plen_81_part_01
MLHGTRGALGGTGAQTACVRCAAGGYGRGAILQGGESEACCARAVAHAQLQHSCDGTWLRSRPWPRLLAVSTVSRGTSVVC